MVLVTERLTIQPAEFQEHLRIPGLPWIRWYLPLCFSLPDKSNFLSYSADSLLTYRIWESLDKFTEMQKVKLKIKPSTFICSIITGEAPSFLVLPAGAQSLLPLLLFVCAYTYSQGAASGKPFGFPLGQAYESCCALCKKEFEKYTLGCEIE